MEGRPEYADPSRYEELAGFRGDWRGFVMVLAGATKKNHAPPETGEA